MKLSENKFIKLSRATLWFEVVINSVYLLAGVLGILLIKFPFPVIIPDILLIIFNILNIVFKILLYFNKFPKEKYKLIKVILLIYIVVVTFISIYSIKGLFFIGIFFLILYKLNSKYNYYVKV